MAGFRWTGSCHRIFHRQSSDGLHDHRLACGVPDFQDRPVVFMAFWGGDRGYGFTRRLHSYPTQCVVDHYGWLVGMAHAHHLWCITVYHDHRHSLRKTTFQDGPSVARSFWKEGIVEVRHVRGESGFYLWFVLQEFLLYERE